MAKDKKNKTGKKASKSSGSSLKALAQNPLVADVVAAALVATAAALKDSKRARALASDVGDELTSLSNKGAKRGEALWDMALQIGRRSLEAMMTDEKSKGSKSKAAKAQPTKAASSAKSKKNSKKKSPGAAKKG